MPWTKEELIPHLEKMDPPPNKVLKKGQKYLGRDVPKEYFIIQNWCVAQGISNDPEKPDLTDTLQGIEHLFQAATGKYPEALSPDELKTHMISVNREDKFEGGVLRQFPELKDLLFQELLRLPKGEEIIAAVAQIEEYQYLFQS